MEHMAVDAMLLTETVAAGDATPALKSFRVGSTRPEAGPFPMLGLRGRAYLLTPDGEREDVTRMTSVCPHGCPHTVDVVEDHTVGVALDVVSSAAIIASLTDVYTRAGRSVALNAALDQQRAEIALQRRDRDAR